CIADPLERRRRAPRPADPIPSQARGERGLEQATAAGREAQEEPDARGPRPEEKVSMPQRLQQLCGSRYVDESTLKLASKIPRSVLFVSPLREGGPCRACATSRAMRVSCSTPRPSTWWTTPRCSWCR